METSNSVVRDNVYGDSILWVYVGGNKVCEDSSVCWDKCPQNSSVYGDNKVRGAVISVIW